MHGTNKMFTIKTFYFQRGQATQQIYFAFAALSAVKKFGYKHTYFLIENVNLQ